MNQPARQTQALANRPPSDMVGSYSTASAINARLEAAADQAHLVSPMTSVGQLPPGWAVAITSVLIDVERETYPTSGGKVGLSKVALDRISAAAGISWVTSERVDDGSHPHYCAWKVVGYVRNFDGTSRPIVGSKQMDLRDGSETAKQLGAKELGQMRRFIMEHAETKARLRAVRSIGVATGYTKQDLQKPFVIAQLMLTGKVHGNPELETALALRIADAALAGSSALYGAPAAQAQHAAPMLPRSAPPPVGAVPVDDDDDLPESWNKAPQPVARTEQRQAQPAAAQQTQDRQREPGDDDDYGDDGAEPPQSTARSGYSIPGGQEKGTPIEDASDSSVDYWAGRIATSLDSGTSRSPARDRDLLAALRAEQESRR